MSLTACQEFTPVFTGKYQDPEVYQPERLVVTHSIADLAKMYSINTPKTIDRHVVISGVVSTTDQPGNFYKSFYIQDETGGMEIKMGRNGLYNDYKPGQRIYIKCQGLTIGMYGYKASAGNGMISMGYSDPSGEYETSYLEAPILIDQHIFRGAVEGKVEALPLKEEDFPGTSDTQATNSYIGKLVTISNLTYGGYDEKYSEDQTSFVLLYLNSNLDKDASSNRIFVSGEEAGKTITTWAMSKEKMTEYICSGVWDHISIGSGSDSQNNVFGKVGDKKGDGTYPEIEKNAYSVSQYFSTPSGTNVQLRTSGYSKFGDYEIPAEVLNGQKTINITGILTMYNGGMQIVVNSLDDIVVND